MFNNRNFLPASIFVFLMACATESPQEESFRQVEVEEDFVTSKLVWGDGREPGFVMRWRSQIVDGIIEICGAVRYENQRTRTQNRVILGKSFVKLEDEEIMRDMRFFRVSDGTGEGGWGLANCKSTGVEAPSGEFSVYLGWTSARMAF